MLRTILKNNPLIVAVISIRIADSPVKGLIYIIEHNSKKGGFCTCRGQNSEVFYSSEEPEIYHSCKDWFMDNFDGFVQTKKLEGDDELQAIKDFCDFSHLF